MYAIYAQVDRANEDRRKITLPIAEAAVDSVADDVLGIIINELNDEERNKNCTFIIYSSVREADVFQSNIINLAEEEGKKWVQLGA